MDVLEYLEKRKAELTVILAQCAFDQNQQGVNEVRGAMMEFELMRQAFTPKLEITVEEPEEV